MRISFIIPSRNNLVYLQQCVNSIIDCYGTQHDIVLLDDASTDGTWEWINSLEGDNIIKYRNNGPDRVGHTILYDVGVSLSKTEVFTIFHADMITTKNHIPNSLKHLTKKTVVAATRIEPPLHPPGPEKFIKNFGFEPDTFMVKEFNDFCKEIEANDKDKVSKGIFAPWLMYKEDFENINGHDPLFAPMELEDSDIFNRMHIAGYNLIQSRDALVYHMTCRGSRFKDGIQIETVIDLPDGTKWYKPKDSQEYITLRQQKFREWWRKWACDVLHDENMYPIVPNRYHKTAVIKNCTTQVLSILEPWFDNLIVDCEVDTYIKLESPNTHYIISDKFNPPEEEQNIIIMFDAKNINQNSYDLIKKFNFILDANQYEPGEYEIDIFNIKIKKFVNLKENLIKNLIVKKK